MPVLCWAVNKQTAWMMVAASARIFIGLYLGKSTMHVRRDIVSDPAFLDAAWQVDLVVS